MLLAGQSVQLNCTFVYKHTISTGSEEVSEKYVVKNASESNNLIYTINNFNISLMTILHCTTGKRQSCVELETVQLNNQTISIFKRNVSVSDTGSYFCQYNNSENTEDSSYMKIGFPPASPEDVSCISVDLMNLSCSWKKSKAENPFPISYSSFINSSGYDWFLCPHQEPESCSVLSATQKPVNYTFEVLSETFVLIINTTVDATGDSKLWEYEIQKIEIVKLSPPKINIVIIESREITLMMCLNFDSWMAQLQIKTVLFEVSYKSEYSEYSHQLPAINATDKCINVTVSGLIPFTKYTITVRIKGSQTKGDKYWSDPVTTHDTTKADIPDVLPDRTVGGFSRDDGFMYIYVKPITLEEKNSENASYLITVRNEFGYTKLKVPFEDTTINITNISSNSNYTIDINTVNDIGQSKNANQIFVPVRDTAKEIPINIVVEKSDEEHTVMWESRTEIETKLEMITVYWCRGDRINHICRNEFNWKHAFKGKTNETIRGLREAADWLFAVAYHYKDGYNTGMIFADCYFNYVTAAPTSVAPFNVIAKDTTELFVKPIIFCSNNYPSRPLQYVVYYKKTDGSSLKSCDETFQNKTIPASFGTKEITIKYLKPAETYMVCMRVKTAGGYATSNPIAAQTLAVGDVKVQSYVIAFIVVGVVVSVSIFILIFWQLRKRWKETILEITLPQIKDHDKDIQAIHLDANESNTDSGVSSDNISDNASKASGEYIVLSNEQAVLLSLRQFENLITNNDELLPVLNPAQTFYTENNSITLKEENVENIMERERSISDVTDGYDDNVTLKSSHISSSRTSSCLSHNSKTSRRKLTDIFEVNYQNENVANCTQEKGILMEIGDFEILDSNFKKEKNIINWITQSNENLDHIIDNSFPEIDDSITISQNETPKIQEYVKVDNDDSLKSKSFNQNKLDSTNNPTPEIQIEKENVQSNIGYRTITDISPKKENLVNYDGALHDLSVIISEKSLQKAHHKDRPIHRATVDTADRPIHRATVDTADRPIHRATVDTADTSICSEQCESGVQNVIIDISSIQCSFNIKYSSQIEENFDQSQYVTEKHGQLEIPLDMTGSGDSGVSNYVQVDQSDSNLNTNSDYDCTTFNSASDSMNL